MKKVFIGVLAALMLFAFTACEQSGPALSTAVRTAEIVQNGVIFEGQPFDASKFTVNVTYTDGTPGTIGAGNVTWTKASGNNTNGVMNGDTVSIKLPVAYPNYGGNTAGTGSIADQTFTATIVAYKFDSIEVSGPETVNSTDGTAKAPEISSLSAVATYRNSEGTEETVNLSAADLVLGGKASFVDSTVTKVDADTPTAEAKISVKVKYQESVNTTFNYTVQYVASAVEDEYTYKWTDKIYYTIAEDTGAYVNRGLFNAADVVTLYKQMQAYDEDGQAVSPAVYTYEEIPYNNDLQVTLASSSALKTTDGSVRFGEGDTATIEFVYRESDSTGKYTTVTAATNGLKVNDKGELEADTAQGATISVKLRDDYPTSFEASWVGAGGVAGTPYKTADTQAVVDKAKDFTYTVTWKSGYAENLSTFQNSITMVIDGITGSTITQGTASGSKGVTFTYKITDATAGYVDSDLTATTSITIEGPTA